MRSDEACRPTNRYPSVNVSEFLSKNQKWIIEPYLWFEWGDTRCGGMADNRYYTGGEVAAVCGHSTPIRFQPL
ncbi:hypothetical protein Trydic_g10983 [Trypoxylus dichotomus]